MGHQRLEILARSSGQKAGAQVGVRRARIGIQRLGPAINGRH